jgi:hypothetical protein
VPPFFLLTRSGPATLGLGGGHGEGKSGGAMGNLLPASIWGGGAVRRRRHGGQRMAGGSVVERNGGQGMGEKGEEEEGIPVRPSPQTEMKQGGSSAVAGEALRLRWAAVVLGARGGSAWWRERWR